VCIVCRSLYIYTYIYVYICCYIDILINIYVYVYVYIYIQYTIYAHIIRRLRVCTHIIGHGLGFLLCTERTQNPTSETSVVACSESQVLTDQGRMPQVEFLASKFQSNGVTCAWKNLVVSLPEVVFSQKVQLFHIAEAETWGVSAGPGPARNAVVESWRISRGKLCMK